MKAFLMESWQKYLGMYNPHHLLTKNIVYYLRTKFQDGIDKPQKCRNVCYHPTHQQQSDFLILVLYDFIVQNILVFIVIALL